MNTSDLDVLQINCRTSVFFEGTAHDDRLDPPLASPDGPSVVVVELIRSSHLFATLASGRGRAMEAGRGDDCLN
jgi:hypothetical protein